MTTTGAPTTQSNPTNQGIEELERYRNIDGIPIDTLTPRPHHVLLRWLHKTESKGHVLIPQIRERKFFAKAQVLRTGPQTNSRLQWGTLVTFDINCEKEWFGLQSTPGRDTVFFCEDTSVLATIDYPDSPDVPRLTPLGKWLLVKPDPAPSQTSSGLEVPEAFRNRPRVLSAGWRGEVLSTGENAYEAVPGDRIAYDTAGTVTVHQGDQTGQDLICMLDDHILGIEESENKAQEEAANDR